jgi:hypothetical protein
MNFKMARPWNGFKGQQPKPEESTASGKPTADSSAEKPTGLTGIRNWNESVAGISAERLRNCIIYQLDVKKDPWWAKNLTRGLVRREKIALKLDEETPEDYVWTPDPLMGPFTVDLGDGEKYTGRRVLRDPKTPEERQFLRSLNGGQLVDAVVRRLVNKACAKCRGSGYVERSDYPDDPMAYRLTSTYECECVHE